MNKINIPVNKIWSYQTLTYKNGNRSFRKANYKAYLQEMSIHMRKLEPLLESTQIAVRIHFKCNSKTVGDLDNITKPVLDCLQECDIIKNDRYITKLEVAKTFEENGVKHKNNEIELELVEVDYGNQSRK